MGDSPTWLDISKSFCHRNLTEKLYFFFPAMFGTLSKRGIFLDRSSGVFFGCFFAAAANFSSCNCHSLYALRYYIYFFVLATFDKETHELLHFRGTVCFYIFNYCHPINPCMFDI